MESFVAKRGSNKGCRVKKKVAMSQRCGAVIADLTMIGHWRLFLIGTNQEHILRRQSLSQPWCKKVTAIQRKPNLTKSKLITEAYVQPTYNTLRPAEITCKFYFLRMLSMSNDHINRHTSVDTFFVALMRPPLALSMLGNYSGVRSALKAKHGP